MALVPAAGDLLNVQFVFTNVATATAINVLHYRVGAISGAVPNMTTFLNTIAQNLAQEFLSVWEPTASDQVKFVNCRVTSVFPLPRSVGGIYAFPSGGTPGGVESEALPLQDAVTILKRTAVGMRWGMGRLYLTGTPENAQSNGIISNDQRTLVNAIANWIGEARNPIGVGWNTILNPCLVRGPEDNPTSITNILSAVVSDNILKTQRRRRPGKGV
jgi:hypothetical protein